MREDDGDVREEASTQEPTGQVRHPAWTFMTNHAHVLFCLAREPDIRLREVADLVGITERAVQRIVADLQEGGYITVHKEGRRNRYEVNAELKLRHPVENHRTVAELMELIFDR